MPFTANAVVEYIKAHGPAVPNQLRQALGANDNFIVGAVLSELVGRQKLAMTSLSYGTSKFYYDPEHPESIEELGKHLGEKDQRAFTLIKAECVVRHSALTPLNRVAMAQIKDFAAPLKLETPEGPEIFWHYFLVSEEEAMDLIEEKFFKHYKKEPAPEQQPTPVPASPPITPPSSALAAAPPPVSVELTNTKPAAKKRAPKKKPVVQTIPDAAPTGSRLPPVSVAAAHGFASAIHEFFASKKIVLVQNIASTKTEFSGMVRIPSAVGAVEYFCKAKSKKTTTDGDLASAVLESQQYKLPLLYLSAGKLTKKASDLLPGLKGAVVATLGEDGGDEDGDEGGA